MVYPKFPKKIGEKAIWNPKKRITSGFPKKWVIIYYREIVDYLKKTYKATPMDLNNPMFEAYQFRDIGIVKMNGVGSPHAVVVFEDLISRGGKIFLNIGSAGGLVKRGIFLCTKSLRDEGTSYHYLPDSEFSFPDLKLTKKIKAGAIRKNISFEEAGNWTIDAQFRETRKENDLNIKKGISTIEMEASALFAVAEYRKVKIASAFAVRDTLIKTRKDFLSRQDFLEELYKIFDSAISCLEKLK